VRFSKVVSYGNACDLDESDFLEYLVNDSKTKVIAVYIEGTSNGTRFRNILEKAAKEKVVVLLKGGVTRGGARAAAGHTSALAGDEATWDALCKQLGVIRVDSLDEMVDLLVTLVYMPVPDGRNTVLIGAGGGASVLITDEFEKRGLIVPPLSKALVDEILTFTPSAGNILQNPVDYGQSWREIDKGSRLIDIVSWWKQSNFIVKFYVQSLGTTNANLNRKRADAIAEFLIRSGTHAIPTAVVLESGVTRQELDIFSHIVGQCVSAVLPVYHSFSAAAHSIDLLLHYDENNPGKLQRLLHTVC
jgi:acyl-CoA synthetase (NDP forming)